jgi:hypothetical protein
MSRLPLLRCGYCGRMISQQRGKPAPHKWVQAPRPGARASGPWCVGGARQLPLPGLG